MADLQSAFNNINSVKISIASKWGVIDNSTENFAWSPEDVVIEAQPGNDGNVYNTVYGSGGDVLLSATPLVNVWTVTIHFLFKSKTYARFSYLQQKILETVKDGTKPGWLDFSLEDTNDPSADNTHFYESLTSSQAMMITIPGKQWGARPSGDTAFSFILCNATYLAPGYLASESDVSQATMPLRNEE